jgi:hypothetical protein
VDPLALELTAAQRRQLRRLLQHRDEARLYRRALAILEVARGQPIAAVAVLNFHLYHYFFGSGGATVISSPSGPRWSSSKPSWPFSFSFANTLPRSSSQICRK